MDEIIMFAGGTPVEYFCCRCRSLRLSPKGTPQLCGLCSNHDLIIGPIGSLDKEALIRKLDGLTE